MTPDTVETRIGRLEFFDGFPTEATTRTVFDHLDFIRGVEVFLNFVPAASLEAMRRGLVAMGVTAPHQVLIFDELMDSNPLFLTGNTDTVYCRHSSTWPDDGPTVVEVPPGSGPGTVNDAFFRFVIDMGAPGPDRGQGGKYLIVPADYDGEIPDGYFVGRSPSRHQLAGPARPPRRRQARRARTDVQGGAQDLPVVAGRRPAGDGVHQRLRRDRSTPSTPTTSSSTTRWPGHRTRAGRPRRPGTSRPGRRIGIRKGQPFAPDERMRALLDDAAAVGNATARAMVFQTRDPAATLYETVGGRPASSAATTAG